MKGCLSRSLKIILFLFFFLQYFTANRDRISIVENVLSPPIQTRYLRLHPWGWHGYISMRAEFYGCRSGNELK